MNSSSSLSKDSVDDRQNISAGAKFTEADILGQSIQLIIGKRNALQGLVEIKNRRTGERRTVKTNEVVQTLMSL